MINDQSQQSLQFWFNFEGLYKFLS